MLLLGHIVSLSLIVSQRPWMKMILPSCADNIFKVSNVTKTGFNEGILKIFTAMKWFIQIELLLSSKMYYCKETP
jgi:hypothetical protein